MEDKGIELGGRKAVVLIMGFALLCWGRVLSMGGLWGDDWAWVWQYFGTGGFDEFVEPFRWLRHMSVGSLNYSFLRIFELLDVNSTYFRGFIRLVTFTANGLLIYSILGFVLRKKTILPLAVAFAYIASPVVNSLYFVDYVYHLLLFFYLLSVLLSVKAVGSEKVRVPHYLLSVILFFASMVSLESFVFFDVLRPVVFLYIFLNRGEGLRKALLRSALLWSPFMLLGVAVLLDVAMKPQSGPYSNLYSMGALSPALIAEVFGKYVSSLKYVFLSIYSKAFKYAVIKDTDIVAVTLALASSAVFLIPMRKTNIQHGDEVALREARMVAAFGFIAVLIGLSPYMLTRDAVSYGVNSRHGLLASVGASLFFPSFFLALHLGGRIKRNVFLALLGVIIFLGALQCNYSVGVHKSNWEHQRSIWWQMIWRAPDIKENSFMIIDMPWGESPGGGSFVLPAEMNLAYAESREEDEIYSHFALALINAFRTDQIYSYRDTYDKEVVEFNSYRGPMSFYPKNLIAASYRDGYLYLNDEIVGSVVNRDEDMEFLLSNAAHDRIIYETDGKEFPLRWILGPEPEHDWKYYCQRANALSGAADHAGVKELYAKARAAGYELEEVSPHCLFPFAAAHYVLGETERASALFVAWAESPAGKREIAVKLFEIEGIREDVRLREKIEGEIERIWR